jgi:hypothetical protein
MNNELAFAVYVPPVSVDLHRRATVRELAGVIELGLDNNLAAPVNKAELTIDSNWKNSRRAPETEVFTARECYDGEQQHKRRNDAYPLSIVKHTASLAGVLNTLSIDPQIASLGPI